MKSKLWIILPAVSVAVIAFLVYLVTLAPSITWRNGGADSGELAAAVVTLGIPHPPGYPTYVLLGRSWIIFFPNQEPAYALNLLSATSAALAAGLSTLTICLLGQRQSLPRFPLAIGGLLGGLLLAFAPLTWSQATITEVYAPGLAALALFTLLLFEWERQPIPWKIVTVGLVGGLGIGLLPQMIFTIISALIWLFFVHQKTQSNIWQVLGFFGVGAILGLITFTYLPLRAAAHPLYNWGDPSNLARFLDVVTAAEYREFVGVSSASEWLRRLLLSLNHVAQNLSWAGMGLALIGIYPFWRHHRAELVYLLILGSLTLIFQTNYYAVVNNWVYLLPLLYSLAFLAGMGVAWLLTKAQKQLGLVGPISIGTALIIALAWRTYTLVPHLDISTDQMAVQFSQQTLAELPHQSLIITNRDESTFSLWYRQALGERPDVVVIDKRLFVYQWYRQNLHHHYPDLDLAAPHPETLSANRPIFLLFETEEDGFLLQSLN